jgi:hypothetical protein
MLVLSWRNREYCEMPPKNPLTTGGRERDGERMVMSSDASALRRGRRGVPRTQVFRPALIWSVGAEGRKLEAVVLDLNPQGMKLRALEALPEGKAVVQLMRDEAFTMPLSQPLNVEVLRVAEDMPGFFDHGLKVVLTEIKKSAAQPTISIPRPITPRRPILKAARPAIGNLKRPR